MPSTKAFYILPIIVLLVVGIKVFLDRGRRRAGKSSRRKARKRK